MPQMGNVIYSDTGTGTGGPISAIWTDETYNSIDMFIKILEIWKPKLTEKEMKTLINVLMTINDFRSAVKIECPEYRDMVNLWEALHGK